MTADPTTDPTYHPTLEPTAPTAAPTLSPTYCLDAKFKGNMSLSEGDFLWNNESFTSMSCECKLVLSDGGNLILFSLSSGSWLSGWESSTSILDYSGKSVSKLEWDDDDKMLVLNEYIYRNVPAILPIRLWTNNVTVTLNRFDPMLVLNDDCCLELMDSDNLEIESLWTVCAETDPPTAAPTEFVVVSTKGTAERTTVDLDGMSGK